MWNKTRTDAPDTQTPVAVAATPGPAATAPAVTTPAPAASATPAARPAETKQTATIGKSVVIKGDVSGTEDLFIDGQVEGSVDVSGQILTIGPNASIKGPLMAKAILIMGSVLGDVTASATVTIHKHGSLTGSIDAPQVALADGGIVQGRIDTMSHRRKAPADLPIAV